MIGKTQFVLAPSNGTAAQAAIWLELLEVVRKRVDCHRYSDGCAQKCVPESIVMMT
jgi:hypothetical protein